VAQAGRQPDWDVTMAQLPDQYLSTAWWDVSTRESNLGYIRRTIKPAIGSTQVRKVRGPLLDTLYARLMRSGNLAPACRYWANWSVSARIRLPVVGPRLGLGPERPTLLDCLGCATPRGLKARIRDRVFAEAVAS
jgi:hypothetical protein